MLKRGRAVCACGSRFNLSTGADRCCRCRARRRPRKAAPQTDRTSQLLAIVAERNAAGVRDIAIAAELGVSREYVRQLRLRLSLEPAPRVDLSRVEPLLDAGFDVLEYVGVGGWLVRCVDCGREHVRPICDAARRCVCKMVKYRPQIGDRYNSWTIIDDETVRAFKGRPRKTTRGKGSRLVLARCDCGHKAWVSLNNLVRGLSKSCRSCGIARRDAAKGLDPNRVRAREKPRKWNPARDNCACGKVKLAASRMCQTCAARNARGFHYARASEK